nr:WD40 repeat domain-containing protein [Phytohabitans rumicis]
MLVADQFEEAFTLCRDDARRSAFIRALQAACTPATPGGPVPAVVILGLRADFYGRCLEYAELAGALQDRQMVLGPMTSTELRDAITRPAQAVGLRPEAGLVEVLRRDLGGTPGAGGAGAYDPGALPLLSHALLAIWQRRQAGRLTVSGYRAAGGIHGAVAATAERAWAQLRPDGQAAARRLLLRLVRIGEDTRDTRRRTSSAELTRHSPDSAAAAEALEVLARERLVTLDAGCVEISHEALLRAWPRLRRWIDQDRAGNLARQRLEEDAAAWERQGRDPSLIYRGARLETVRYQMKPAERVELTTAARAFLTASTRHRRRAIWARRGAVAAVALAAVVAVAAAAVAVRQRDEAVFRQVLAEADRLQATDQSLSAQLNLVAHRMRRDDKDVYTRLISTTNTPLATPLTGHTGAVYLTSFRPDGRVLATASYDNTARLWDLRDPTHPAPLGKPLAGHTSWVTTAVFRPDGRLLATAGDDKTIRLWDVTDPANASPVGRPITGTNGTVYLVAFSPDGHTLATANEDHTVRLWDVRDPAHPAPLGRPLTGHTAAVRSVAFSPDGRLLASAGDDQTIRLWNVASPAHAVLMGRPLTGHSALVHSVAISPDGRTLASGSKDKTIRLWNVSDPARPAPLGAPLTGHNGPVWSVKFSPDGRALASGSVDSTTRLWNLADPSTANQLGPPLTANTGIVFAVEFSPDGRTLAAGSADSVVRVWSIPRASSPVTPPASCGWPPARTETRSPPRATTRPSICGAWPTRAVPLPWAKSPSTRDSPTGRRSAPTETPSPRQAMTKPSAFGTSPTGPAPFRSGNRSRHTTGTRRRSTSTPADTSSRRPATTRPSNCGTPSTPTARPPLAHRSPATPATSTPSRSAPTGNCWPPRAATRPSGCGTYGTRPTRCLSRMCFPATPGP